MSVWTEKLIIKNRFSRPGLKLLGVKGIVMHWTADPGATDENEVKFFDGTDGGGSRYASAHIFVDKDSATLDIPLNEVAYHANEKPCKVSKLAATASYYKGGGANLTSIGVEMCVEKNGTIHQDTISRSVDVAVQLCKQFNLDPLKDIYRHYDITGKNCPAPWVKNGQEFEDFKKRVNEKLHPPVKAASVEQKAYRLVTGTFKNTKDQQAAADKLKKATGWVVYTIESNGLRLQTGTFKTKTDVAKAQKLVKDKFGWLTYIK